MFVCIFADLCHDHVYSHGAELHTTSWSSINRRFGDVTGSVLALIDLVLTIPATSVGAERGFSIMNRVKTDYRNTLRNPAMNDLMRIILPSPTEAEFDPTPAIEHWYGALQHRQCCHRTLVRCSTTQTVLPSNTGRCSTTQTVLPSNTGMVLYNADSVAIEHWYGALQRRQCCHRTLVRCSTTKTVLPSNTGTVLYNADSVAIEHWYGALQRRQCCHRTLVRCSTTQTVLSWNTGMVLYNADSVAIEHWYGALQRRQCCHGTLEWCSTTQTVLPSNTGTVLYNADSVVMEHWNGALQRRQCCQRPAPQDVDSDDRDEECPSLASMPQDAAAV